MIRCRVFCAELEQRGRYSPGFILSSILIKLHPTRIIGVHNLVSNALFFLVFPCLVLLVK